MSPSCSDFEDYRDFLKFRFETMKSKNKNLSSQSFGMKFKASRSYLSNVLSKAKHVSLDRLPSISIYLKLSRLESEYVLYQFLKSQAEDPKIKEHFELTLEVLRGQLLKAVTATPAAQKRSAWFFARFKSAVVESLRDHVGSRTDRLSELLVGTFACDPQTVGDILNEIQEAPPTAMDDPHSKNHSIKPSEFENFKAGFGAASGIIDHLGEHHPSRFEMGLHALTAEQYREIVSDLQILLEKMAAWSASPSLSERQLFLNSIALCSLTKPFQSVHSR